jgi:choline dehydrogenase-like flavoprotein
MRDVIIIGAGAGGPVVAKELAAKGLNVLLLEAGAYVTHPELSWTLFENDAINSSFGYFRFGPADRSKEGWKRDLAQTSLLPDSSGVGGTTNRYAGNCPRAMPGVFPGYEGNDKQAYDAAHLFPFGYKELVPYYEWVEHTLPVETAPMGTKEEIFFDAAEKLGLPLQTGKDIVEAAFRPQENAILQPRGNAGRTSDRQRLTYPQAYGCCFCGHCYVGCVNPHGAPVNLKAKRSTNSSYVPMALTADSWAGGKPATLITDAFVTRINVDLQLAAQSVTWRVGATGETVTEESKVIVMAGGTIETPRLWLNSGLPNPNEQVGRGLTDHYMDNVIGVMPFYTGNSKGPGSNARVDLPGRGMLELGNDSPASQVLLASFSDAGIAGFNNSGAPEDLHGADAVGALIGLDLKAVLSNLDKLLNINVMTDDDVELQNRITLSTSFPPDEHGPVARIEVNHRNRSGRTVENREFLAKRAVELLRAAGASKVYRINWPPLLFHVHSTMRMGLIENDSVLDENGEARWVKRLFIADGSALANSLGGPNPALTIQALATRTAEKIFQLYFDGDPWVGKESPVSSADISVTEEPGNPILGCYYCHGD